MLDFTRAKVEGCFGHSRSYDYFLERCVDEPFLEELSTLGELEVKRHLRRPFFFLHGNDGTELRGTLGDQRIRASFPEEREESCRRAFEQALMNLRLQEGAL